MMTFALDPATHDIPFEARWERVGSRQFASDGRATASVDLYVVLLPYGYKPSPATVHGLPEPYSVHPEFDNLIVDGENAYSFTADKQVPDGAEGAFWRIEVKYGVGTPPEDTENEQERETQKSWEVGTADFALQYDAITGKPFINRAGKPYEDSMRITKPVMKLVYGRGQSANPVALVAHSQMVNSASIKIMGITIPKHCGLASIHARDLLDKTAKMPYEVTFEISVLFNMIRMTENGTAENFGWDFGAIEKGFHFLDSGELKRFMTKNEKGEDVETPDTMFLTSSGGDGRSLTYPVITRWNLYPETDFSAFGLPQT